MNIGLRMQRKVTLDLGGHSSRNSVVMCMHGMLLSSFGGCTSPAPQSGFLRDYSQLAKAVEGKPRYISP